MFRTACSSIARVTVVAMLPSVLALTLGRVAQCSEFEGFTEPYRTIDIAADETGIVEEILVREGETVIEGQTLARLNSEIHLAMLAIADQNMKAEGRVSAARAEIHLRRNRLEKLEKIKSEGFARQEEVDRARVEASVADANLQAVMEDIAAKKLEYEKIQTQIRRRSIAAPISGIITAVRKDRGEFVAPNTPEIATIVQIDKLLANFTLLGSQSVTLKVGQPIEVSFHDETTAPGIVEYIAPVNDAESGTTLVKICIDNTHQARRSGERCRIRVAE